MTVAAINRQAVTALFEVCQAVSEATNLGEAAAYLIVDDNSAVNVGREMLDRLVNVRRLALKHMATLSVAAGVPVPDIVNALAPTKPVAKPARKPRKQ